jgi:leader peptidase (prepilin peptidase)/N-methyltransferase
VEFLTGFLYLMIWLKVLETGQSPLALIRYFVLTALAVSTFFIDIRHFIIPDATTYPAMLAGIIVSLFFPESFGFENTRQSFVFSFAGALASLIFMSLAVIGGRAIFKRDALGWGDVKYMGAVGACLGIPGAFFTLMLGSMSGSVYGLCLMGISRKGLKTVIPFGPFLALSSMVWIFYGEKLLAMYLKLFRR